MLRNHFKLIVIVGAAAAFSPAALAASASLCPSGPPTAASYTWNFPKEASGLLNQIKADALQVRTLADNLRSLDWEAEYNFWQYDSDILQQTNPREQHGSDALPARNHPAGHRSVGKAGH